MTPHNRKQARILSPIGRPAPQKLCRKVVRTQKSAHGSGELWLREFCASTNLPFRPVSFPPPCTMMNLSFRGSHFILIDRFVRTISHLGGNYEPQARPPGCLGCRRNLFCGSFGGAESFARCRARHAGKCSHESGFERDTLAQYEGLAGEV